MMDMCEDGRHQPVVAVWEKSVARGLKMVCFREPERMWPLEGDVDFWCATEDAVPVLECLHEEEWYVVEGRSMRMRQGSSYVVRLRHENTPVQFELWVGDVRADVFVYREEADIDVHCVQREGRWYLDEEMLLDILILRPLIKGRDMEEYIARVKACHIPVTILNAWLEGVNERFGKRLEFACRQVINGKTSGLGLGARVRCNLASPGGGIALGSWVGWLGARCRKKVGGFPLVAVAGTDGSGKSTLVEELETALRLRGINAEAVYAGRSKQNSWWVCSVRRIAFWLGLYTEVQHPETEDGGEVVCRRVPKGKLVRWVALVVYCAEYRLRYVWWRWRGCWRHEVTLLDRGAWDLATMEGLSRFPVCMGLRGPRHDLTVICHAPIRTILSRKAERRPDEILRHQAIYAFLAYHVRETCVFVDTSIVSRQIPRMILQVLSIRFAVKTGGLDTDTARWLSDMPLSIWTVSCRRRPVEGGGEI